MNNEHFSSELKSCLVNILGVTYDAPTFFLLLAIGVIAIFIIGKLFASWIGGSNRGFIASGLGILLPLFAAFVGYYLGKEMGADWSDNELVVRYLPTVLAIAGLVLILIVLSPFFMGLSLFKTAVIFAMACLAVMGTLDLSRKLLVKQEPKVERIWYNPMTWFPSEKEESQEK